tara:strand:+ start:268 stop:936 length:669 start_codon:yes stop_codon:yes gene_type:complete
MAISKLNFNSLNVTPTAGKAVSFDSGADDLEATLSGGSMVFIKKLTASSSGTLTFHNGTDSVVLDNTYKEYVFVFNNIHPSSNTTDFTFQGNVVGGSGFNESITSTFVNAYHDEADSGIGFRFLDGENRSQNNETAFNLISVSNIGNDNDQCMAGTLTLFNPSSTTFVKHFIVNTQQTVRDDYIMNNYVAGYFNTTAAIDEIQFKMASGNIDAGTITLYGIN